MTTDSSRGNAQIGSGKALTDYPQPSVAVDTAVLSVEPDGTPTGRLAVLLIARAGSHHGGRWSLPGTFLHEGERLADAVDRSLREKAGVEGRKPRQLRVFDDPQRDERGRVLSVAHVDVAPFETLRPVLGEAVRLGSATNPGTLPYDHRDIVRDAVADLRARYAQRPDPDQLLGKAFTHRDLRRIHEAIAGKTLQRDTIRRAMEPYLAPTGKMRSGHVGRPAELFKRR